MARQRIRRRRLPDRHPQPSLGDLLTMRDRIDRTTREWMRLVTDVRANRFHQDQLPTKWRDKLGIDDDELHRFRTNLTDNEISRVVALMTRNRPKVYVPPVGDRPTARSYAEKQTKWSQELIEALERQSVMPIWDRGDDAAVETSLGVYEVFLTEDYDRYADLAERISGMSGAEKADAEAELRAYGLPFGVRALDPTTVRWEPGYGNRSTSAVLISELKDYRQVYGELADSLDDDAWEQAHLPDPDTIGNPDHNGWRIASYDGHPDEDGQVEVLRYYDDYWLVEYVAGRCVQAIPHGLPGCPIFLQFGKVTSSTYRGYMLRGVTFGMLEHETVLNDLLTLWEDNQFSYGRPFPVVQTSENGSPLVDQRGNPVPIDLSDPEHPPQLGPGQTVADAFGQFRGQIDPAFVQLLNQYFHMSGLNPIAQGESPGADASGFALNTQQSAATALYVQLLKNKQRTMGEILDFARSLVRDVCGFGVTVASGGSDGQPLEYVTLYPDEVTDVPTRVTIDPLSDAQRMAVTQWAINGEKEGYLQHRTVQRIAYGSVIDDLEAEDRGIIVDQAKRGIVEAITQAVIQRVIGDAFPELAPPATPPGGGSGVGGAGGLPMGPPAPQPSTIGREGAEASRQTPGGQSPAQTVANGARGGQQPANQGVRMPA